MKPLLVMLVLLVPAIARAQVAFPPENAWVPLRCGDIPMIDSFEDDPGALDERDLVGITSAPTGMRASDDDNLYLRMRLDEDPAPGGAVRPFGWGVQFDLDGDLQTYELMILADGVGGPAGAVSVFENTVTTLVNDPADPADEPAAAVFPFADNARSVAITFGGTGGTPDFHLEIGIPWSTLIPLGLDRTTPTFIWVGTSSTANSLDGDLACHDGGSGAPTLIDTASDETTGDPAFDPDAVGIGRLEGGGGCDAGGAGGLAIALALLGLGRRARTARA